MAELGVVPDEPVPDWAEEWLPDTCGCGGRLVRVEGWAGRDVTCCSATGYEVAHCPDARRYGGG